MEFRGTEETIYLVGGGPSLISFDWRRLDRLRTIAINRAYQTVPKAEAVYFTDRRFYDWHGRRLLAHPGRLITGCNRKHKLPAPIEHWRITGAYGIDTEEECIRHGNSSGYAAINVAVHLGAKQIILLGYDMRFTPDGRTHWHDGHHAITRASALPKMLEYFESAVEPLRALGVTVLNANPDSAIECFEKTTIDEVLPR